MCGRSQTPNRCFLQSTAVYCTKLWQGNTWKEPINSIPQDAFPRSLRFVSPIGVFWARPVSFNKLIEHRDGLLMFWKVKSKSLLEQAKRSSARWVRSPRSDSPRLVLVAVILIVTSDWRTTFPIVQMLLSHTCQGLQADFSENTLPCNKAHWKWRRKCQCSLCILVLEKYSWKVGGWMHQHEIKRQQFKTCASTFHSCLNENATPYLSIAEQNTRARGEHTIARTWKHCRCTFRQQSSTQDLYQNSEKRETGWHAVSFNCFVWRSRVLSGGVEGQTRIHVPITRAFTYMFARTSVIVLEIKTESSMNSQIMHHTISVLCKHERVQTVQQILESADLLLYHLFFLPDIGDAGGLGEGPREVRMRAPLELGDSALDLRVLAVPEPRSVVDLLSRCPLADDPWVAFPAFCNKTPNARIWIGDMHESYTRAEFWCLGHHALKRARRRRTTRMQLPDKRHDSKYFVSFLKISRLKKRHKRMCWLYCHSENGNGNVTCNAKSVAFSKRYPVTLTLSSVTTKCISCIFTVTLQRIVICLAIVM